MIIDGRQTGDLPDTSYDIVIVGAGPAGITLAMEMAGTGLSIALLESGGVDYDDDAQALNQGHILGNDDEYDLEFSRLRQLGGTSNHWGGQCTPLDSIDFERSWNGFSSWPLSRAELDPFYERAHTYCDVGAYRYAYSELAPSDPHLRLFAEDTEYEEAILRQSTPTRFGNKYRAPLAKSESIDVWLWTTAIGVSSQLDLPNEWVETRTPNGTERRFSARAVVLAAGAIETTRLLLWSNARNETSAGDAGGLLGACYMDHPAGGAAFLHLDTPIGDKIYWSDITTYADDGVPLFFILRPTASHLAETGLANATFYMVPFAEDNAEQARNMRGDDGLKSIKMLAKWVLGRDVGSRFSFGREYCNAMQNADDLAMSRAFSLFAEDTVSRILFRYEAEQRPDLNNTVTLDPDARDALGMPRPVLRWSPSEDDMASVRAHMISIGRLAGRAGLGRVELEPHDADPYWSAGTAWHQLGTMRMAESPTSGVVDPECRVHGAGALYVASGAVFPTVGRANPTLTIVALSIRLADHLKERLAS